MKTNEELNALKDEMEALRGKLIELTDEEMNSVVGGAAHEIADIPVHGLMSDNAHPGMVM